MMTSMPLSLMRRRYRGFSLIELLFALVIIGVLARLAYGAYTQQVVKSNRRAAQAQMMDIAIRQQQFLLANRSFATKATLESNGYSFPTSISGRYSWDVAVGSGSLPTFTITFTATGTQASDGELTLTADGAKSPSAKWD